MVGVAIRILGGLIKIVGNTTGIPIGNVLDALKVTLRDSTGSEIGTPGNPLFVDFPANAAGTQVNTYGEVLAVASSTPTIIASYTVPIATTAVLERISVSGENIAMYTIKVNATIVEIQRTYFGGDLNANFEFVSKASLGYPLVAGDVVSVTVVHTRPSSADFEARIQTVEIV